MSTSPPCEGSKKCVPSARSNSTKNCDPAMNGVAITTSREVVKFAQTSSGMRQKVIPGAHGDDRDQEVERGHDRRRPRPLDAHVEEDGAELLVGRAEGRVTRPAATEAGDEEAREHH